MPRGPASCLWIAAIVLCSSAPVWAAGPGDEEGPAYLHFDRAARLYEAEDYAGAAREFSIAYALDPSTETMFAWAQAERLAGQGQIAIELYQKILRGKLSKTQRKAIETLIAEVEVELVEQAAEREAAEAAAAAEAEAERQAEAEAAASEPEPEVEPEGKGKRRKRESARIDVLGASLAGVGGALSLAGIGLLAGGGVADARVRNATSYPDFEAAYNPGTKHGRGAVALYASGSVALGAGVAMLAVGVLRLTGRLGGQPREPKPVALAPMLGPQQAGLLFVFTPRRSSR